MPTKVAAYREK